MQLRPVGRSAVLVEVADVGEALGLAAWARDARLPAVEVVPGARTVLFDGMTEAELRSVLDGWAPSAAVPSGDLVEIAVVFDGADIDDVARRWGTDRGGVAQRLGDTELVAAFGGFAPGFAYLAGLPEELAVPRLDSPRASVPAGAVGLADGWCGIYPTASPGGWRLVGRTDRRLWDATAPQPALLVPGTRVRLVEA